VERQDGRSQIRIRHVGEKAWRDLARCQVEISDTAPAGGMVAELRAAKLEPVEVTTYYGRLEGVGVAYGPNFRGVRQLWSSPNGALGRIELPADAPGARDPYNIHPALLDAAFQVMGGALLSADSVRGDVFLPIGADAIRWLRPAGRALWVGIKVNAGDDPDVRIVDIALEDDGGEASSMGCRYAASTETPSSVHSRVVRGRVHSGGRGARSSVEANRSQHR
jgi:acyl transferase domain-containing protein